MIYFYFKLWIKELISHDSRFEISFPTIGWDSKLPQEKGNFPNPMAELDVLKITKINLFSKS